jgi:hypothetical protein
MKPTVETKMRDAAARLLRSKGYSVTDTSQGSGVPKNSRLELRKGGEKLVCSVKTSTGGRISFVKNDHGEFKVLKDVGLVLHCQPITKQGVESMRVSLFEQKTVLKAFEENVTAMVAEGNEHLPVWLNPEPEEGTRFTGSGFGTEAIWRETVPISLFEKYKEEQSEQEVETTDVLGDIKSMISERLGVRLDRLEIDIRIKL